MKAKDIWASVKFLIPALKANAKLHVVNDVKQQNAVNIKNDWALLWKPIIQYIIKQYKNAGKILKGIISHENLAIKNDETL